MSKPIFLVQVGINIGADISERILKMIDRNLMNAAIEKWGVNLQTNLAQEECAELIVEIAHFQRGRKNKEELIEEIADVTIMAYQMAMIFGEEEVQRVINEKMKRLENRLRLGIYNE